MWYAGMERFRKAVDNSRISTSAQACSAQTAPTENSLKNANESLSAIFDALDLMDDESRFDVSMAAGKRFTSETFTGKVLPGGVHHVDDESSTAMLRILFDAGLLKRGCRVMDFGCGYPLIILKCLAFTGAPVIATDQGEAFKTLLIIFSGEGNCTEAPFYSSLRSLDPLPGNG
jgi:hypothetical protein